MKKLVLVLLLTVLTVPKLYQVVSLFRHGARYHLNDLADGNSTFAEWGELTPIGMRQHQNLGKTLGKQYIKNLNFLSEKFNKNQIQVYSTDINRTIISAMSQLYGIYPPGNGPRLTYVPRKYHLPPFTNQTDIDEQNYAFPFGHQHVMIKFDQNLLLQHCPKLNQYIQKNVEVNMQDYQEMTLTYTPFIKKMIGVFKLPSNATLQTLCSLYDTLVVDKYLGRPMVQGFTAEDFENIKHITNWYNNLKFSNTASHIINTGKFQKIINEFDSRIKNITSYPRKWTFLSAHDTDVLPAQVDLNFSSYQCVQQLYRKGSTDALNCQTDVGFASSIIFELHSDNEKDFYVKVRSQGKYMNLCEKKDTKCSYNQFKNRLKNLSVKNAKEMCGITAETLQNKENYRRAADLVQFDFI